MARATAALDVETGGGEVLATVAHPPPVLVASELIQRDGSFVSTAQRLLVEARRPG
jgi:hypothetical protein